MGRSFRPARLSRKSRRQIASSRRKEPGGRRVDAKAKENASGDDELGRAEKGKVKEGKGEAHVVGGLDLDELLLRSRSFVLIRMVLLGQLLRRR